MDLIEPHGVPVRCHRRRIPFWMVFDLDGAAISGFQPDDQLLSRFAAPLLADAMDDE